VLADRLGIELIRAHLLVAGIAGALQARRRRFDLRPCHVEDLLPRLRSLLLQEGVRRLRLRLELLGRRALNRVIDREEHAAPPHHVAFVDEDVRDDARDLWVHVYVFPIVLIALYDSIGVDPILVGVRSRLEHWRKGLLLRPVDERRYEAADEPQ